MRKEVSSPWFVVGCLTLSSVLGALYFELCTLSFVLGTLSFVFSNSWTTEKLLGNAGSTKHQVQSSKDKNNYLQLTTDH